MKKLVLLCVMLLILLSALLADSQNKITEAETIPTSPEIDTVYIEYITNELSQVIYKSYGEKEIARGREFGSEGEQDAAEFLADEMEYNLSLYDPTPNDEPSYRQQLRNTGNKDNGFYKDKETSHLQVLSKKFEVKNSSGNITEVECYISPIWY